MIRYRVCAVMFAFLVTVVDTDAEVCRVFIHGAVCRGRVAIGRHQVSVRDLGPVLLLS